MEWWNMNVQDKDQEPASPDFGEPPADISSIAWLIEAHAEQLALCRQLEDIADSLPANINRQKCIYAAKALQPLVKGVHKYEENVLFPWLEGRASKSKNLGETLNRLKFEHCEDECYAEDVSDMLLRMGSGDPSINHEAIGYMLRGFFEAMRRHIAFEREHLLDVAISEGKLPIAQ